MMNKLSEAYRLESDHMPIEEGLSCCICGDEFEIGQIAVGVSAGMENPRLVQEAHLGCAINDDEIEFDGIPSIIQNLKTVK